MATLIVARGADAIIQVSVMPTKAHVVNFLGGASLLVDRLDRQNDAFRVPYLNSV